jgi:nucleoside-diphosphate-sugar epimerase
MPDQTQVTVGDPARPGNLYGATKVWAEALGAWVAATTPTSVVTLRIGYFFSQRLDAGTVSTQRLSAWPMASPPTATAVPTWKRRCSNWATVRSTTPGNLLSRPPCGM